MITRSQVIDSQFRAECHDWLVAPQSVYSTYLYDLVPGFAPNLMAGCRYRLQGPIIVPSVCANADYTRATYLSGWSESDVRTIACVAEEGSQTKRKPQWMRTERRGNRISVLIIGSAFFHHMACKTLAAAHPYPLDVIYLKRTTRVTVFDVNKCSQFMHSDAISVCVNILSTNYSCPDVGNIQSLLRLNLLCCI